MSREQNTKFSLEIITKESTKLPHPEARRLQFIYVNYQVKNGSTISR